MSKFIKLKSFFKSKSIIYCKLNKDITLEILEELNKKISSRALIHICGRTTSSLLNLKLIDLKEIKIDSDMTYGEALLRLHDEKISMIGQNCIKDTKKNCKGKILYKMENLYEQGLDISSLFL